MIVTELCPICKEESLDSNCGVDFTWKPHRDGGESRGRLYYCMTCWDKAVMHMQKLEAIRKLEALSLDDGTDEEFLATFLDEDIKQLLRDEIIPQWLEGQEL